MKSRHVPLRMCTGCGEMKPKDELIRVTQVQNEGQKELIIDKSFKASGRGAYVCKNTDCVKILKKSRRLEKLFSQKILDAFYEKLEEVVSKSE